MTRVGWLSIVLAFFAAGSRAADWAEADRNLIVVADPAASPPAAPASADRSMTLEYHVVEILSGETASPNITVVHAGLTADERARLAAGERVILMATPDAGHPGRYVASSPLRATDAAVAAFRAWSARPPSSVAPALPAGRAARGSELAAPALARPRPSGRPARGAPLPVPASRPLGPPLSQRVDLAVDRPVSPPLPLPPG
jgi:hypothetical protein